MAQYSFSTSNETIHNFVDRRRAAQLTLHLIQNMVKVGKITVTDTQVFLDPEEVDELVNQLRGEVELIAESLGHILDRNV